MDKNIIETIFSNAEINSKELNPEYKEKIAYSLYSKWLKSEINFFLERKERECFECFVKNKILLKMLLSN